MGKKKDSVGGLDYVMSRPIPKSHRRIVLANAKAKDLGLTYGKYMAGLWEKEHRVPIVKEFKKPEEKEPKRVLLKGEEAAEHIKQLKIKAGTWEEPKAKPKNPQDTNQIYKAKALNEQWPEIKRMLVPHIKKLEGIAIVSEKKEASE